MLGAALGEPNPNVVVNEVGRASSAFRDRFPGLLNAVFVPSGLTRIELEAAHTELIRRFYLRPRVTATWAGLPVFEGESIVVARAGRDPWAPVPLASFVISGAARK